MLIFFLVKTSVFPRRTSRTNVFLRKTKWTKVFSAKTFWRKERKSMSSKDNLYLVNEDALPDVLKQVVEAKRLLETNKSLTIQEATDAVGISRSSFYKYKDEVTLFHDSTKGKTITFMIIMEDEPGLLSSVLGEVAKGGYNILTIHQSVPVNNIATVTISIKIVPGCESASVLFEALESMKGICNIKILARE